MKWGALTEIWDKHFRCSELTVLMEQVFGRPFGEVSLAVVVDLGEHLVLMGQGEMDCSVQDLPMGSDLSSHRLYIHRFLA